MLHILLLASKFENCYQYFWIILIICFIISFTTILVFKILMRNVNKHLSETKTQYSAVFENATIGIEYYDVKGFLRDINEACFNIVGFQGEKSDVIAKVNLFENPNLKNCIFSDNPNNDLELYISDIEKLGGRNVIIKYDLREGHLDPFFKLCKVDKLIYLSLRFNLIRKNDNELKAILCTYTDVTEFVNDQQAFKEQKIKAQESERQKSFFLANMSHEIRTPLNSIIGFSDLLAGDDCEADEKQEYSKIIHENSQLLLSLINDILDLSKLDAKVAKFNYSDFDFVEMLNNLKITHLHSQKKEGVQFFVRVADDKLMVHSDKQKLTQIINNFVINAFKYTENGEVELSYLVEGNSLKIMVKDTGIGIAEDKKRNVFGRFEKLDEYASGTGLGLSICKALAENMHGEVGFESEQGNGSTFWVSLPVII